MAQSHCCKGPFGWPQQVPILHMRQGRASGLDSEGHRGQKRAVSKGGGLNRSVFWKRALPEASGMGGSVTEAEGPPYRLW